MRLLRERYPGVPVVTYVNTSAEVKAESDICCTSANAVEVVESLGVPRVIFLPDEFLAKWVASQTAVEILAWHGHCEVHERFTGEDLRLFRAQHPGVHVLAHPECPPDVLAEADYVGSTSGMIRHVKESRPPRVVLITECSMSDNVAVECPDVEFVRPVHPLPAHEADHAAQDPARASSTMRHEVEVEPEVAARARRAVERDAGGGAEAGELSRARRRRRAARPDRRGRGRATSSSSAPASRASPPRSAPGAAAASRC